LYGGDTGVRQWCGRRPRVTQPRQRPRNPRAPSTPRWGVRRLRARTLNVNERRNATVVPVTLRYFYVFFWGFLNNNKIGTERNERGGKPRNDEKKPRERDFGAVTKCQQKSSAHATIFVVSRVEEERRGALERYDLGSLGGDYFIGEEEFIRRDKQRWTTSACAFVEATKSCK